MKVRIRLGPGFENVIKDLNRLGDVGIEIAKKRFTEAAPIIVARQKSLAPVDEKDGGQLRDSVRFTKPRAGGKTFANVTFIVGGDVLLPYLEGRSANVYAIVQETDPTLSHRVGQAGFMSQPVAEMAPGVFERIQRDIDAEVARASG